MDRNQQNLYMGSAWENCNFPHGDNSLYDESMCGDSLNCSYYNNNNNNNNEYTPKFKERQLYSSAPQQRVHFYANSTSSDELCVNFNQGFYSPLIQPSTDDNTDGFSKQRMLPYGNYQDPYECVPQTGFPFLNRNSSAQATNILTNQHLQVQQKHQSFFEFPQEQQPVQSNVLSSTSTLPSSNFYHNQNTQGMISATAPCRGNQPWTYSYCYGYAPNTTEPCQFTQFVDIEDFMNNEKRKEKSRNAARCRRSRETEIFTELAQALPMKQNDVSTLDKASVMRIAIAYLKIREMLQLFPKIQALAYDIKTDDNISDDDDDDEDVVAARAAIAAKQLLLKPKVEITDNNENAVECAEAGKLLKQTMDGFLIILSNDGDITYVSENIVDFLGIAKIDILGQQIWEYSHQCDHAEFKDALNIKRIGIADKVKNEHLLEDGITTHHRDLFVRLKCTLTSRGRSINIKSASYKVIHITGHLVINSQGDRVLVAIGRPIPHPSNIEIPLGTSTFLTKHALDMRFTYVDDKMYNLLGYEPIDLLDKSLFNYHHGGDSDRLMTTFKSVLGKGQGETSRYRFLGKYGGYCWLLTQATIVYDKLKPQSVVCVNYVISNLENKNEIYSLAQFEEASEQQKHQEISEQKKDIAIDNNNQIDANINKCDEEKLNEGLGGIKEPTKQEIEEKEEKERLTINQIVFEEKADTTEKNINTIITNNNNSNNINNTTNTTKTPPPQQQQEQHQEQLFKAELIKRENSLPNPRSVTAQIFNANAGIIPTTTTITNKPIVLRETTSLSPLHRQLQVNCNLKSKSISSIIEEKRPKSVTASVFRSTTDSPHLSPSTIIITNNNNNNINNSSNNNNFNHINNTTTTATATNININKSKASIFTPISQLTQKTFNAAPVPTTTSTAAILGLHHQHQKFNPQQQQQQQDMNNKYLTFNDDVRDLTMLKEEPDDLSHHLSASSNVDACIPLDETTPLFGEMLAGLMGTYGSLLPDDINSLDSTTCSTTVTTAADTSSSRLTPATSPSALTPTSYNNDDNTNSSTQHSTVTTTTTAAATTTANTNGSTNNHQIVDPFINYREESNDDTNCSQHLLSPSVTSKSPEGSSMPSLCSPNSLSPEDDFAFMTMNDEDMDLTMRAPYIPMDEGDDLPLLADEIMWCGGNAFPTEEIHIHKDLDAMQLIQMQQQQNCNSFQQHQQQNLMHQQQQQQQQHFSNSLCSSPASTVSSLSPSPIHHHQHHHQQQQQQQQQQQSQHQANGTSVFASDSSELAALLCGAGNGTLSILGNNCNETSLHERLNGGRGVSSVLIEQQQQQHGGISNHSSSNNSNDEDYRQQLQLQQELQLNEQQQHQHLRQFGLSIECKKENFDSTLGSSLCDSIEDAFENAYSKDSTNLDCWNELLQINVNDTNTNASGTPSPAQQQQQLIEDCKQQLLLQQHQNQQQNQNQQNIIMNAVPLITIQSNKNVMLPQQQQQQQQLQQHEEQLLLPTTLQRNISNNNKISTIKLLNTATTIAPITTKATIRLIETTATSPIILGNNKSNQLLQAQQQQQHQRLGLTTKVGAGTTTTILQALVPQQQQQQQQQHQQQQHGNKRHLSTNHQPSGGNSIESKRLKCGTMSIDLNTLTTPQLLQQLIGGNGKDQPKKTLASSTAINQQKQQQHQQQSNSVLKNLLVSGCDDNDEQEPMLIDDNSLDRFATKSSLSAGDGRKYAHMLHCETVTASLLRNYRNNPMIGGDPNALQLSPPPFIGPLNNTNIAHSDDSNPPGLTSCDTDTASDSGIDDISLTESISLSSLPPQKQTMNNSMETTLRVATPTTDAATIMKQDMLLREVPPLDVIVTPAAPPPQLLTTAAATENNGNAIGNDNANDKESGCSLLSSSSVSLSNGTSLGSTTGSNRKSSISFMDSSNTLLTTPFLMDLCNDDYNMSTNEFLDDNELEQVLGWTNQLV